MGIYRYVQIIISAALLLPTSGVPTPMASKVRTEKFLQRIYSGLGILKTISFYEMMSLAMNISHLSGIKEEHVILKALGITCDLHRVSTDNIKSIQNAVYHEDFNYSSSNNHCNWTEAAPPIQNSSSLGRMALMSIVERIGRINTNDSCRWLEQEVKSYSPDGNMDCSSLPYTCKKWDSYSKYAEALRRVNALVVDADAFRIGDYLKVFPTIVRDEIQQILAI